MLRSDHGQSVSAESDTLHVRFYPAVELSHRTAALRGPIPCPGGFMTSRQQKPQFASLIAQGRALGLPADAAKDVAQEALAAATAKCPEKPHPYARQVVRNLAGRWRRDRGMAERNSQSPDDRTQASCGQPDILLENAGELAKLSAAVEHFVVWGEFDPGGKTYRVVSSLAEIDVASIQRELRFYLRVVDGIPVTTRHKRRLRDRLRAELQAALGHAGYCYRGELSSSLVEAVGGEPAAGEAPPNQLASAADDSIIALDEEVGRGVMLLERLGVDIGLEQALSIVGPARDATWAEEWPIPETKNGVVVVP